MVAIITYYPKVEIYLRVKNLGIFLVIHHEFLF